MDCKIGRTTSSTMIKACKAIVEEGASVRKVSRDYGVARRTFDRYLKKLKDGKIKPHNLEPNYSVHKVFTSEEEKTLLCCFAFCKNKIIFFDVRGPRILRPSKSKHFCKPSLGPLCQ